MAKGIKNKKLNNIGTQEVGERCDLNFSHNHILRLIKESKISEKVSIQAAIYFSAVLEYITAEVLDSTLIIMKE